MPTVASSDTRRADPRRWVLIDASGQVLGRLSARIASILRGKNKPTYSRHLDVGDFVVVVNAEKVRVTGRKLQQKRYFRHSGYPGGLKEVTYERLIQTHPERVIEYAVRGMLPNTPLGRRMFAKLKVYRGSDHPHTAQRPVSVGADQGQVKALSQERPERQERQERGTSAAAKDSAGGKAPAGHQERRLR